MRHWANRYIGLPWERGARGPEAYDCWGLLCETLREHYGVNLPTLSLDEVQAREEFARWRRVKRPQDGDGVLMKHGRDPHVGLWLDVNGGACLHSLEGVGVVLSNKDQLFSMGWTPAFYRYVG